MELEAEVERAKTVIENYELDYERVVVRQEKCGHELNEDRILDLTTRLAAAETRYHELIMSVGNKYHDETRHQTALRYIQQAEKSSDGPARDTIAQIGGNNG